MDGYGSQSSKKKRGALPHGDDNLYTKSSTTVLVSNETSSKKQGILVEFS